MMRLDLISWICSHSELPRIPTYHRRSPWTDCNQLPSFVTYSLLCQTGLLALPQTHHALLCPCSYSATLWAWATFSSFLSFSDPCHWSSTLGPSPTLTSSRAAINCFIYLHPKSRFYSNKNIQGQKSGLKFTDCNDYRWAQAVGSVPGTLTTKWEDSLMVPRIKCKKIWATSGKKEMERSQVQWEP